MKLYFDNKIRKIGVALMMTAMLSNVLTPSLSVVAMDIQQETTQEEMVDNESTISENVSDNNELQEADDGTITTDSSNVTDKVDDSVDKVVDSSENLDKNIETSQLDVSKASPEKETVETRNSDYTLSAHGMTLHVNELATLSTADIAQKILTDSEATIKEVNNNPIPSDMQLFVNGIESLTPVAEKQEVVISSNNSDLPEITIPVFVSDDDTGIMDTRYMGWDKIVVLYMKDFEIKHSEYFDWHKLNIGSYELNYFDDLITAYDIQTGEQLFRDFFQSTLSLLMPSDTVPEDIQGDFHTRLAWWVQSERMPHSNLTIIDDTYKIDVANGTRTDSEKNPNVESTVFSIKADPAPEGQVFDKWVSDNGGTFADETSSETTFTMPANDVSLTATYKVAESSLTFAIYENFYGTRLGKLTNLNVIAQKPYGSDSYITDTTINPDGTVTVTGAFEVGDFIQIGMGNPEWENKRWTLSEEDMQGNTMEIDLDRREVWVSGTISDKETGNVISNAKIEFVKPQLIRPIEIPGLTVETGADGKYNIYPKWETEIPYTVKISAEGYITKEMPYVVEYIRYGHTLDIELTREVIEPDFEIKNAHGLAIHKDDIISLSNSEVAEKIIQESQVSVNDLNNTGESLPEVQVIGVESLEPIAKRQEVTLKIEFADKMKEVTIPVFIYDDDTGFFGSIYTGLKGDVIAYVPDYLIKHSERKNLSLNNGFFAELIQCYFIKTGDEVVVDQDLFLGKVILWHQGLNAIPNDIKGDLVIRHFYFPLMRSHPNIKMPYGNFIVIDDTFMPTVVNGKDVTRNSPYTEDTVVSVKADPAPDGQVFYKWVSDNGGTFADEMNSETTFTMPANDVTLTAWYEDVPQPDYEIFADDYSIDVKDVFLGNNDILALSNAKVIDNHAVDSNPQPKIVSGAVFPMTGEYTITIGVDNDTAGTVMKGITVTVTSDLSNIIVNPNPMPEVDIVLPSNPDTLTPIVPVIPNYEITADDYSIDIQDVFNGNNDILVLSSATLVDLNGVDDNAQVTVIDGGDIPAMTGEYQVILGVDNDKTGKFTKEITVTVTSDLSNIDVNPAPMPEVDPVLPSNPDTLTPVVPVIPNYELSANNFVVHIKDIETVNILEKSEAQASNLNDSTDSVSVQVKTTLKKEIGVQTVELGIDKNDTTTKSIQVFVVDDSVIVQDRTVIYANNFIMNYSEKANLTSDKAKELANVKAYDIPTARDLTQDVTVHEQDLKDYIASTSMDKADVRFILPVLAPRQQVNHSPVVEKAVVVTTLDDSEKNGNGNGNNNNNNNGGNGSGNQNNTNTNKKASVRTSNIPKTGDETSFMLVLVGLLLSSSSLGILIYRNRKYKEEKV